MIKHYNINAAFGKHNIHITIRVLVYRKTTYRRAVRLHMYADRYNLYQPDMTVTGLSTRLTWQLNNINIIN